MSSSIIWNIVFDFSLGWLIYTAFKAGGEDNKFRRKGIKREVKIIYKNILGLLVPAM